MADKRAADAMACESVQLQVALVSGRAVQIPASMERTLKCVKLEAQRSLQTGLGVLRDSAGRLLDDSQTVGAAGLKHGDALTLQVRQTMLASSRRWRNRAFAAIMGDGSLVTWGHPVCGGHCSAVLEQLRRAAHPGHGNRICCCSGQWIRGHLGRS